MTHAAWDYVFLGKDFDAAACPGLTEEQLKPLRHEFNYWYPMDMRVSGKDLIRNHLTFSLYNHQAIFQDQKYMTKSYFCNGYLMLNNEKMSKSTGNFLTMDQCIEKYGSDASRIALADAGDFLDDANFDEQVANAAILKLFTLEQWIKDHVPKDCTSLAEAKANLDEWDQLILNKLREINHHVKHSYTDMKLKNVIKYGFNEMLSVKESYVIGKTNAPNPYVIMSYLVNLLIMMNPILPHFNQYCWTHYVLPWLKQVNECPEGVKITEVLGNAGWPTVNEAEISRVMINQFEYLQEAKSIIRNALEKAKAGGKAKKKGKADQPEKSLESCAVFVGLEYPEFQRKTIEIMTKYECKDGELVGDYMKEIRETIKGKESGIACKFAAFIAEQIKIQGKETALQLNLSWSEIELLEKSRAFLFENMPTIKNISIMLNTDESAKAIENSQQLREGAAPGKPTVIYF